MGGMSYTMTDTTKLSTAECYGIALCELGEEHKDVVALTGYAKTTINNWCNRGQLKSFRKGQLFYIPKIFLIDFFCSLTFRSITRKSLWHIQTLNDFQRKMKQKK